MSYYKFKTGDMLRCMTTGPVGNGVTRGKDYKVVGCTRNGLDQQFVTVENDNGEYKDVFEHRFELASGAPTARANDPATSKGKRKVNKYEQAVLATLDLGEGNKATLTGKEIAQLSGHPLNCITPRFAPLRRKGLIAPLYSEGYGHPIVKRDKQIVWVLV